MLFGAVVNRALAALLFLLLVAPQLIRPTTTAQSADRQSAESAATASSEKSYTLSSRERDGLRGPVEACNEETIIPPLGPTGLTFRGVEDFKYYPDGRVYQRSYGDGTESFTYDAQGRLLTGASEGTNGPEIIYTYDFQGRLMAINGDEGRTTTFEYDDQGRKTRIIKSDVKPSSSPITPIHGEVDTAPYGLLSGGIDDDDMDGTPPEGGLIRTSFNERGQATESKVYNADGDLVSRLSQTYDAKGRMVEFVMIDTKMGFLTPEGRELLAANPAAYEEERRELIERISYVYDDEDRIVEKYDHEGFSQETITKITYNDHSDEIEEISTVCGELNQPEEPKGGDQAVRPPSGAPDSPSATPESHVVQFSYRYDSFGNWIEKTVSSPASAQESGGTWSITHRTITYY